MPKVDALRGRSGFTQAIGTTLSILGFGLLVALVVGGVQSGRFTFPGGDVTNFLTAGARLRDGQPPYVGSWDGAGTVYFAPPWIVVFGAAGLLPSWVLTGALIALDVVGLRYLTGSWRAFGWASLCPLTAFQLISGNPNFAVVAAILAAARGRQDLLVWAALAKLGPAIAVDVRRWRPVLISLLVAVALTLPWPGLWLDWIRFLISATPNPGWPVIVPLILRIPFIVLLLATRRRELQALAAALAIPGFYIVTAWATIILILRLLGMARSGRLGR